MNPPTTHFDQAFDAIELNDDAPSRAAIEHAMAICGPGGADAPGFYLLDDSEGLFVVDRDFGVVSLRDEAALERVVGQVRNARLKVVQASGRCYELTLRLLLSGAVPQVVGQEAMTAALLGEGPVASPPPPAWDRYSPALARGERQPLQRRPARFGALTPAGDTPIVGVCPPLARTDARIEAAAESSDWSL